MTTVKAVSERSERRFRFVIVTFVLLLGLNLVSLFLVVELRSTVNTNSAQRSKQIATLIRGNAAELRLLRGRR